MKRTHHSLKATAALASLILLTSGCEDDNRLRQAQADISFWQTVAFIIGGVAVVSVSMNLWNTSKPSGPDLGGDSGGGRRQEGGRSRPSAGPQGGNGYVPSPADSQNPDLGSHNKPASNGSTTAKTPLNGTSSAPTFTVVPKPPCNGHPAWSARYFVIDGLNICRSYHSTGEFRLETLLCLATQILRHGADFECHFDASTRYRAVDKGSEEQRAAYEALLARHPRLFSQVPAGEPADATVLFRANSMGATVVSNDRFAKPTETYRREYPWLENKGRHIHGRQFQGRLLVTSLGLDIPIQSNLSQAVEEFERAYQESRANKSAIIRMAA